MNRSELPHVILHVGMAKSGSSAIQRSFANYDNDEALYPRLHPFKAHIEPLQLRFTENYANYREDKAAKKGANKVAASRQDAGRALKRALRQAGRRKLIFSSENMYLRLDEPSFAHLKRWLEPRSRKISVIAYLRPPIAFASSEMQQSIRTSLRVDPPIKIKPYQYFQHLLNVFGEENVELIRFDRKAFVNGNIVEDFAARLGIVPPPLTPLPNEGRGLPLLGMLVAFNREFAGADAGIAARAKRRLSKHCNVEDGSKLILPPEMVMPHVTPKMRRWCDRHIGADFIEESPGPPTIGSIEDILEADPGWHPGIEEAIAAASHLPAVREMLEKFASGRRP